MYIYLPLPLFLCVYSVSGILRVYSQAILLVSDVSVCCSTICRQMSFFEVTNVSQRKERRTLRYKFQIFPVTKMVNIKRQGTSAGGSIESIFFEIERVMSN